MLLGKLKHVVILFALGNKIKDKRPINQVLSSIQLTNHGSVSTFLLVC